MHGTVSCTGEKQWASWGTVCRTSFRQGLGTAHSCKPTAEFRLSKSQVWAPFLPWGTSLNRMCQVLGGQGTEYARLPPQECQGAKYFPECLPGLVRASR